MESMESQSDSNNIVTAPRDSDTSGTMQNQNLKVFRDRIIFMSMYNDVDWSKGEEKFKKCISNSTEVKTYTLRFPKGHWSFLGPAREYKWYGTHTYKPDGEWKRSTDMMMITFKESGHPFVFRATSALDRGFLQKQERWTVIDSLQR